MQIQCKNIAEIELSCHTVADKQKFDVIFKF